MEGGREKRRLSPMSGELQEMVDFEPHDPTKDERQRRHPKRPPPATRGAVILHGLGRLALILVAIGGGVTLIAWIVADHSDKPLSNVLPTAFYFAAAGLGVFAVLGGTSGGWSLRTWGGGGYDRAQRAAAVNASVVFACLAILLFGFGLLLDYVLER
jgi:hypothetical protein